LFGDGIQAGPAYYFENLSLALERAKRSRLSKRRLKPSAIVWLQYFYDGMTALKAARVMKKREYLQRGREAIKNSKDFLLWISTP
jgi:hypothetical protein